MSKEIEKLTNDQVQESLQIKIAPYVAHGIPDRRIEDQFKIKPGTINKWMEESKLFSELVDSQKKSIGMWHNQQFAHMTLMAYDQIIGILSMDYESSTPSQQAEIARLSRSIVTQISAMPQGGGGSARSDDGLGDDVVDTIARRIVQIENRNSDAELSSGYNISEVDAFYSCHKDTRHGKLNVDNETGYFQCHVCGDWTNDAEGHLMIHDMLIDRYEEIFKVELPRVDALDG